MSVKSIAEAYAQHGSEGLTEKGNNVRITCIAGTATGTTLIITGIVIFVLLQLSIFGVLNLFPNVSSLLGGTFGSAICMAGGAGLTAITLGKMIYLNSGQGEYINANPRVELLPDPREGL